MMIFINQVKLEWPNTSLKESKKVNEDKEDYNSTIKRSSKMNGLTGKI
jgi:hypothetical protein